VVGVVEFFPWLYFELHPPATATVMELRFKHEERIDRLKTAIAHAPDEELPTLYTMLAEEMRACYRLHIVEKLSFPLKYLLEVNLQS